MISQDKSQKILNNVICMLPAYSDPDWQAQPDNLKCDVDYAKQLLLMVVKSTELINENETY